MSVLPSKRGLNLQPLSLPLVPGTGDGVYSTFPTHTVPG